MFSIILVPIQSRRLLYGYILDIVPAIVKDVQRCVESKTKIFRVRDQDQRFVSLSFRGSPLLLARQNMKSRSSGVGTMRTPLSCPCPWSLLLNEACIHYGWGPCPHLLRLFDPVNWQWSKSIYVIKEIYSNHS